MNASNTIDLQTVEHCAKNPSSAKDHLRALLVSLTQDDESIQNWATEALENCGPPHIQDLPWLKKELGSNAADVAYWSATLIGRLKDRGQEAIGNLSDLVANEKCDPTARARAVWAIGELGASSQDAIDALVAASNSTHSKLARAAADCLTQLK